ncbi:MAG: hypothetical protein Q4B85_09720, partial [Lachnospiraceae bacterium]|nr:hypothetical protein [Lachnospiraceae bacterium]
MKQKIRQMSLLQKLVMLTFVSMLLVLLINILIFGRLNMLNRQIGDVYTDNTNLELLGEKLDRLQQSVEDYVRSRSTNSIEAYYKEEEEFRNQVELLNAEISDDEILLAEKNIRGLSESYMKLAADIIQAKRGRNVKKYGALSEEAIQLRKDISNCIESLK